VLFAPWPEPQSENVALDYLRLDERVGPQSLEQLILGDKSSSVLDQISQHAKCFRRQTNPFIVSIGSMTPETLVDGVQPEES
jgi:hypothetical protein